MCQAVGCAQPAAQALGDRDQHLVGLLRPEAFVQHAKAFEIDVQQRQPRSVAPTFFAALVEPGEQECPVGQTGQRVEVRQAFDRRLHLAQPRKIGEDADAVGDAAIVIRHTTQRQPGQRRTAGEVSRRNFTLPPSGRAQSILNVGEHLGTVA